MVPVIVRDPIPRRLSYSLDERSIGSALEGVVCAEDLGLYFLYDTGAQRGHYDAEQSHSEKYPVLVAHLGAPPVKLDHALNESSEEHGANPEGRSILVFAIKTRLKGRVKKAFAEHATRPLRNWFAACASAGPSQRPLVLYYDEQSGRITTKFADDWDGPESRRVYT